MPKLAMENLLEHHWHHLPVPEITELLDSNPEAGLSSDEITRRQESFGANELSGKEGKSPWLRFLQQFNQSLIYILLVAGAVTLFLQDWVDAGVIFAVTIINATIGFIQESKAESAIAALAKSVTTEATVIRNSQKSQVPSTELVPGDLVLLSSGDKVPADLRLVKVRNLQIDESALTGESVPVEKATEPVARDTSLGDRTNMAYAGSLVTFGQGRGIVVAIAEATETGRISQLMERHTSLETPLTRKIQKFSKLLLYVILGLAALTFAIGLGQGESWVDVFQAAVALAVSAIPEGLPAIVTITLAIGVSRMADRHAIIRKLPAVETLGSTTTICSDKTGTLTENQMTVQDIYAGGEHYPVTGVGYAADGEILEAGAPNPSKIALKECLIAGLLCNDSHLEEQDGQWKVVGDPTEGASIVVAGKADLHRQILEREMPRVDSIPFESEFQYMATLHEIGGERQTRENQFKIIYVKGSLEAILKRCDRMLDNRGQEIPLEPERIEQETNIMAQKGLRVLAFAKKPGSQAQQSIDHGDLEKELIFLGLQGMIDPPRQEAIAAVRACQSAGIQVKMITGDHAVTASAIARQMGLSPKQEVLTYTGQELARMNDEEIVRAAEEANVFARVAPEQKLRLVEALQSKGEIVAMTGDGVNDAPALRQADIGIAMGITGTEVAKEAADTILTDDNFASIEAAVEEGRTVYQNIRQVIAFILPVNGGESMTILISVFLATALPILPVQILWVNMISSVALSVPLAFEPKSPGIMQKPPRNPNEPLLTGNVLRRILAITIANCAITFGMFEWGLQNTNNLDLARTMAVQGLVSAETFYLLSMSRFIPLLAAKIIGKSKPISYAPAIGIACLIILQVIFSQWSLMNQLLATVPLSLTQALICIGAGLPVIVVALLLKRFDPLD
jgi:Ca2+-transporting ATPase